MIKKQNNAFNLFYKKMYDDAFKAFLSLEMYYECGYCKFVTGDIENSRLFWKKCEIESPAINWGFNIVSLLNLTVPSGLTFFLIRNVFGFDPHRF